MSPSANLPPSIDPASLMVILDTNVISEFSGTRPHLGVVEWVNSLTHSEGYVTAVTEAELRYGIGILPAGQRRESLLNRVEKTLERFFAGRILPFDSRAARSYAAIASARRGAGKPLTFADGQIAAIAHSVGAAVATRNAHDFEGCGIRVINPWSAT